ncbi:MAG: S8 family serine peptidase [Pirellulaceae bacterium]
MRNRSRKMSRHSAKRTNKNRKNSVRVDYQQLETRRVLAAAPFYPNELLVQYFPQDASARATIRQNVAGEVLETVHTNPMIQKGMGALERIQIGNGMTVEQAVAQLKALPGVMYAEPNYVYEILNVSNDTHYTNGNMWNLFSDDLPTPIGPTGTTNAFGSQAEKVWDGGTIGSKDVYVAVLDTGADVNHVDLADNIFKNPFDPVDGIDNDGNGRVDDVNGWDFVDDDNNPNDNNGHGSHVSGTIGAKGGNGIGVAGVNWDVNIIPFKLGDGGISLTAAINSMDYLVDLKQRHGLNIVAQNNSWGGGGFSQALLDAIVRSAEADILVICAAGNSNSDLDSTPFYPASYNTTADAGYDAVISVASIEASGNKSGFSSYGLTHVDLGAPGSDIWSTTPGDNYESYDGTSMASPMVAGAIALFASVNPDATALEMRTALLDATTATPDLDGRVVTGGRLDLSKLVISIGPEASINDVSILEGNSGTKSLVFTVTLAEIWPEQVSIDYFTSSGTAISGLDFQAKTGTITFEFGELSKTISINIIGDQGYEPDETFNVNLTRAINAKLLDKVGVGTIDNDDPHVVGETGVLVNLNSTWRTFTFKRPYTDPVVIMGTPSTLRGDSVTIRVKNVRSSAGAFNGSFEARIEEWDYLDGIHGTETVSYMVFERGKHTLKNGAVIVAGTGNSNHRFADYSFGGSANFTTTPVVLTQVMTSRDPAAVTPRLKDVSRTGFTMRLQEEEGSDRIHLTESFGWVAIVPGRETGNGYDSEVGLTPTEVTDQNYRINFSPEFTRRPAFFAQMQTYNGGDPAVVRYRQLSYRSASIYLEEERSSDQEMQHKAESVGYFALQVGLIVDDPTGGQMPPSFMTAGGNGNELDFVLSPDGMAPPPTFSQLSAAAFAVAPTVVGIQRDESSLNSKRISNATTNFVSLNSQSQSSVFTQAKTLNSWKQVEVAKKSQSAIESIDQCFQEFDELG